MVESPKKRFSLRKTLSKRFSSHRTDRRKIEPLPDEQPVLVLRVQVLACKNIAAADWNGKSDPCVFRFNSSLQLTKTVDGQLCRRDLPPPAPKDAGYSEDLESDLERKGCHL